VGQLPVNLVAVPVPAVVITELVVIVELVAIITTIEAHES
jgi:hypothetical protein